MVSVASVKKHNVSMSLHVLFISISGAANELGAVKAMLCLLKRQTVSRESGVCWASAY